MEHNARSPTDREGVGRRIVCAVGEHDSPEVMRMETEQAFPKLRQVVLDCTDARALAEFYRQLLGLRYRSGDDPPPGGEPDPRGQDWLVLHDADGTPRLAFQQVAELPEATWPTGPRPQQLHLDMSVPTAADLDVQHQRALALGARLLYDRSADPEEPLRVYGDLAGHPFCMFVAEPA
jgi:catechol 2,3-dioxygenase-like lactoylglutathione lyase family enzyme